MIDAARVRANLERIRESVPAEVEICAAVKYVSADDLPALAEGGIELVGENRAQALLEKQARHRRPLHLGLHRRAPEPQGQGRGPERAADPLAGLRLRAAPARADARRRGARAGERGRGGGQGGRGSRRARRVHRALPGAGHRPDDDAALHRAARRTAARTSPGWPSWPPSTGSSACRWAPRRTTRWPCRRARRSCASAASSTSRRGCGAAPGTRRACAPTPVRRPRRCSRPSASAAAASRRPDHEVVRASPRRH